MADKRDLHVVKTEDGWGTIRAGGERHSHKAPTQAEVIAAATAQAEREGLSVKIHGRDGQIREERSFGNDPYPPKG